MTINAPFINLHGFKSPAVTERIGRSDVRLPFDAEAGAWGHWLFGGTAECLTSIDRNARTLTAQSAAPTYSAAHLALTMNEGNALQSTLVDTLQDLTMCVVARTLQATAGIIPLAGNPDNSSGNKGRMLCRFAANTSYNVGHWNTNVGRVMSPGVTMPDNGFVFLASSIRTTPTTSNLLMLAGGQAIQTLSQTYVGAVAGDAPIGLGNSGYVVTPTVNTDFAEFILFDRALSAEELEAVYVNSQRRMAARGVTLAAF
jgi:hypothetical protein